MGDVLGCYQAPSSFNPPGDLDDSVCQVLDMVLVLDYDDGWPSSCPALDPGVGVGEDLVVLQQVPQELLQGEVLPLPGLAQEGCVDLLLLDEQGQVFGAVVSRPWVDVHDNWEV